jgi:phosphatidylserine/phosphatidylglycerophosphate/cardiolipin synthase-like enzyme
MHRFAWALLVLVAGCPGGGTGGARDGGIDAPGPGEDSGAPVDAGPIDAGPSDAARPSCPCPPLPETCVPPAAGAIEFTPDRDGRSIDQLMATIACADTSLHVAMYETDRACIVDAILAQLDRRPALEVDVVIDDGNCPRDGATGMLGCEMARLEGHPRVAIVDDARSALMHHKWMIADGARLWITSGNFTMRSFCIDINDAQIIDEAGIVARFEEVFQRMFTTRTFGPAPAEPETVAGIYGVFFSPETPITMMPAWMRQMVTNVEGATTSIDVLTNAWTRTEISDAIIAAAARGVTVRAIVSPLYEHDAPAQALLAAGVPIRVANVHAKVMVIDGATVATGSANWSESAWSNDENSLWIRDAAMGSQYTAAIDAVWPTARAATAGP